MILIIIIVIFIFNNNYYYYLIFDYNSNICIFWGIFGKYRSIKKDLFFDIDFLYVYFFRIEFILYKWFYILFFFIL